MYNGDKLNIHSKQVHAFIRAKYKTEKNSFLYNTLFFFGQYFISHEAQLETQYHDDNSTGTNILLWLDKYVESVGSFSQINSYFLKLLGSKKYRSVSVIILDCLYFHIFQFLW